MFRKYTLQPSVWHKKPLVFEWDIDAGEIRGQDAEQIHKIITSALKEGSVIGAPIPTEYDIEDPLHRLSEMALLLGNYWKLSEDLANTYPDIKSDDEMPVLIDDQGAEHSILDQVVH